MSDSSSKMQLSRWHRLLRLDQALSVHIHSWQKEWMTRCMVAVTHVGDASTWFSIGFVLLAIGEPTRKYCALLATAAILATIATQIIKHICRRQRPELIDFDGALSDVRPDQYSFPSGHTTTAFAVGFALYGEGAFLGPLLLSAATVIGFSRVYLRAHFPLDVLAGSFLGLLVGLGTRLIVL